MIAFTANITSSMKLTAKQCEHCHGRGIVRIYEPETLKKTRQKTGISMRAMARKLRISPPYLSDIENGNRTIPENVIRAYRKL